ncbi:putative inactive metalloprotease YmfF [Lentibacillus sp. JNUCC-1]|uniref:EF-P 5-aminopentanol modification-associated protein YfmF n=1 Tax=Lentibacillus sp. JNUCC-1 TaxID=2654513 RepID=UPI0012E72316|nr:pitrilysin family protein [Lentibacillus sp. JNUCC-1]MUV39899.1 putative inactive metalloprotease YmfF [Lentibacillus sp. JNUCC-1]
METIFEENNIRYHIVPHQAFKTVSIVLKIKGELSRETITKRALLPYVLAQGPNKYPTRRALQLKLDALYGARFSLGGAKKGNHHVLTLRLDIANQKYIQGESTALEETLQLVRDIIFDPNTTDEAFSDNILNREKATLKKKMIAIQDDKMQYANMRLIDEMCEGDPYHLHVHGYEEDLNDIQSDNLYQYYQEMLISDDFDLYILGDVDTESIKDLLARTFRNGHTERPPKERIAPHPDSEKPARTIIDKQPVQQAKLHIGYRTHCTYKDNLYPALHVFNGLFGGFPSSKLFINVREKNSLAYYAASRIESHKGLMLVFSGINPNDFEQANAIIADQLTAMKKGDFSQEELVQTKDLVVNQLLETMDHPHGLIDLLYQQVLADTKLPPEQLIDQIKAVTKTDVIKVAEPIFLDTVYLLTDERGESA